MNDYYSQPETRKQSGYLPLLLALLLGAGLCFLFFKFLANKPFAAPFQPIQQPQFAEAINPDTKPREAEQGKSFDNDEQEAIDVFKGSKESVVNVDQIYIRRGVDMNLEAKQAGTGSGFVWDEEGRIVTNFHVIKEAISGRLEIRIVLADRKTAKARIIAIAPDYDLAVLQVEESIRPKLKKIRIGTSGNLEVGQRVYALGNPFGYSMTLTKGIISALEREIESPSGAIIPKAIQTQAPINPGNSGGPLLDKQGRMIGVNTQIASPSGGNVGIGFAIPADTVNAVVTELIRTGKIAKPDLGIRLVEQWQVKRWGFDRGVMIAEVIRGGPAEDANLVGLRKDLKKGLLLAGDLILSINGVDINNPQEYRQVVSKLKPGEKVKIRYERNDEEEETTVTVRSI